MTTEWRATSDPRWPLGVLVAVVAAAVPLLLEVVLEHQPSWTVLGLPALAVTSIVGAARARLRLTDEGVELRRLRTRRYRWTDIVSAERAPDWDGSGALWLRLSGSVPTAAPEVLVPPGVRSRAARDRALDEILAAVRARAGLEPTPTSPAVTDASGGGQPWTSAR